MNEAGSSARTGVVLAVIGGVLTVGGVFLTWGKAAISMPGVGNESYTIAGKELANGPTVMGLGIAVIIAALVTLALKGKPAAALTSIATVAGGAMAAILGISTFTGLEDALVDPIVEQSGVPLESFNEAARKILTDAMEVGAGWGLYFSILGGFVAVVGGVLMLMAVRRPAPQAGADSPEAGGGSQPETIAEPEAEAEPEPETETTA
jgi:hypothetical protein